MDRLKPLLLLGCVLTLTLAAGCGNACLKLADQICNCQPNDTLRSGCQAQVREQEKVFSIRSQDEQLCQAKLDSNECTCEKLTTPEGRQACGLAYTFAPTERP
jgi:hypothetical protein